MPKGIVKTKSQEKKWEKAKAIAEKQGKGQRWPLIMHIFKQMSGLNKDDESKNLKIEAALEAQGKKTTIPQEAHEALHAWWTANKDKILSPEQKQKLEDTKSVKQKRASFKIVKSDEELNSLEKSLKYLKTAVLSDLFKAKIEKKEWSPSRAYSSEEHEAMKPHIEAGHSMQEAAHLSGVEKTQHNHKFKISELSPTMMSAAKTAAADWTHRIRQKEASEARPEINPEKFVTGKAAESGQSLVSVAKSYADALKEHKTSISSLPKDEQIRSIQKFKADWHASPAAKVAHIDAAKSHAEVSTQAKDARAKELYEQRKNILLGGQGLGETLSTHTSPAVDSDEHILSSEDVEDIHGR